MEAATGCLFSVSASEATIKVTSVQPDMVDVDDHCEEKYLIQICNGLKIFMIFPSKYAGSECDTVRTPKPTELISIATTLHPLIPSIAST